MNNPSPEVLTLTLLRAESDIRDGLCNSKWPDTQKPPIVPGYIFLQAVERIFRRVVKSSTRVLLCASTGKNSSRVGEK